ncbi:MAG: DUF4258 domain-containing protein [Nevskiales bacterium]
MTNYIIGEHARFEMKRRGLSEDAVASVLNSPEQEMPVRPGRVVYQSRVEMGDPAKTYLIRVFVDADREPVEVVTAYRTSKVEKYWRRS